MNNCNRIALGFVLGAVSSYVGHQFYQRFYVDKPVQKLEMRESPSYQAIVDRARPPEEVARLVDRLFQDRIFRDAFIVKDNTMPNAERRLVAEKYKMEKISRWNYVFKTPCVPGYILKLGPIHWTNSFGGFFVRQKEVTNKNVSRVAYQQLIEQVIKERGLKHVCVVKKFLYKIPDCNDRQDGHIKLSDNNYVVLAEDLGDKLLTPQENLTKYREITEEQLDELRIIATEAHIADLKVHNCVFGRDGKIYLIDTEQTNKAAEADFFLRNTKQMITDTLCGLKWVERLAKARDDPEYYRTMLEVYRQSGPYYQMGIEPDDQPTVTQEFISLTERLRESF